jgi:hypothetical protein
MVYILTTVTFLRASQLNLHLQVAFKLWGEYTNLNLQALATQVVSLLAHVDSRQGTVE